MSDLPMLPVSKMRALERYFQRMRGLKRVDDRRVLSGIVYVIRHGVQWKDAPSGYGPHKTLYNRFIRWSRLGVFAQIFSALTGNAGVPEELMIDSTHLKAHRTAASLLKKGCCASDRTHKRRPELETACRLRRAWPSSGDAAHRRSDE